MIQRILDPAIACWDALKSPYVLNPVARDGACTNPIHPVVLSRSGDRRKALVIEGIPERDVPLSGMSSQA